MPALSAQDAERAAGPLRFAGQTGENVLFVVGPQQPPAAPFTIWQWRYLKTATDLDAIAQRITVDCRANTRQMTMSEGYKLGRFVKKQPPEGQNAAAVTPQPGTAAESIQREACRPNSVAQGRTAKDIRDGRVVADRMLGTATAAPAAPALAAAAPAPTAGAPSPARCKAVAAVMSAGYEQSVKMGKLLLAMGPGNKGSQEEEAKTRKLVADQEAKLARTQSVLRRYASAPSPDEALVKQIMNIKMSDLDKEIDACAAGQPATTQAKPAAAPTPSPATLPKPTAAATQPGWKIGWRNAPDSSESYYEASQTDPSGKFALVYSCGKKSKVRAARIYSSLAFDNTASYAPEVPLKVSIDGKPAQEFTFRFQRMPHDARVQGARGRDLETVDASTLRDPKSLDPFVALLRTAQSSIAISYFDKSMRFVAEPGSASIGKVHAECPGL